MANEFTAAYRAAQQITGGACPIEAGIIGRLVDLECRHGRMPGDDTAPCGCWPQEGAAPAPTDDQASPPAAHAA
jgi:hypothetical protein